MNECSIAYFSMEMALRPDMPTYSGGLGVLAGDTIRSAADLKLRVVAVTLAHRQGYFAQQLDADGWPPCRTRLRWSSSTACCTASTWGRF